MCVCVGGCGWVGVGVCMVVWVGGLVGVWVYVGVSVDVCG